MPIFEFHCKSCRREFRTLRRADQLQSVACPECGTDKVARLLSVTAAQPAEAANSGTACASPMMGGGCCMNPGGCQRMN